MIIQVAEDKKFYTSCCEKDIERYQFSLENIRHFSLSMLTIIEKRESCGTTNVNKEVTGTTISQWNLDCHRDEES